MARRHSGDHSEIHIFPEEYTHTVKFRSVNAGWQVSFTHTLYATGAGLKLPDTYRGQLKDGAQREGHTVHDSLSQGITQRGFYPPWNNRCSELPATFEV